MTPEEQVTRWVAGELVHNEERDECCPDFSCCTPKLLQPVEVRKAFQAADERGRNKLLMTFLGELLVHAAPDKRVRVVGGEPEKNS